MSDPSPAVRAAVQSALNARFDTRAGREDGHAFRVALPDADFDEVKAGAHAARRVRQSEVGREVDVVIYCSAFRDGSNAAGGGK